MRHTTTQATWRFGATLCLTCALAVTAAPARAQTSGGSFGLGIILGEPTGLTGKVWLGREGHAIDFHLAWDFSDEAFAVFVDYLFHLEPWRSPSSRFDLPLYVGVGGKLLFHDHGHHHHHHHHHRDHSVDLGIRVPVGIAMLFQRAPVEIFLEIAPGIRLFPATDLDIDGGIGVRYYF